MRLSLLVITLIILAGCANQVTPTGGEKDIVAPTAIAYTPDSNAINFSATEIVIVFDEYVQLNDVFNQIIISPPLDETPAFKLKGKTLTIKLNATLKPETTYTINFGQAIKDNTEGNILENFTYVFSTGSFIDSMQVSGTVTEILTGAPSKKTYVVLYYEPTDTSFTKTKPYYFAKTDAAGNFNIKNIRSGNYKLYAIEDQNFNYYYDLPNERIAFQSDILTIDSNVAKQKLQLFSEDKGLQNLLESKSSRYGQTKLVFSKNTKSTIIKYTGSDTSAEYFSRNITNDTILFWKTNFLLDTHQLSIQFDTTILNRVVEIKEFSADSSFYKNVNTFTTNVTAVGKGSDANTRADWDPAKPIILNFSNPIKQINYDGVKVYSDSVLLTSSSSIDSLDARKVYINYNWKPGVNYDIIIPAKSHSDIFNLYNTADTIKIATRKTDAYATLTTTIKNTSGSPLIFQLMRFDLSIVEEKYLTPTQFENAALSFAVKQMYLLPGIYRIRIIIDSDGNGEWTTGDLQKNVQPETVIFFSVDQNLRANWENEIDWEIK